MSESVEVEVFVKGSIGPCGATPEELNNVWPLSRSNEAEAMGRNPASLSGLNANCTHS